MSPSVVGTRNCILVPGRSASTILTFTSPSVEPLLWVPDIVAFAQSHLERGSDAGYAVPLAPLLRVVPVEKSNPR